MLPTSLLQIPARVLRGGLPIGKRVRTGRMGVAGSAGPGRGHRGRGAAARSGLTRGGGGANFDSAGDVAACVGVAAGGSTNTSISKWTAI